MTTHVALVARFKCTDAVRLEASELPFTSMLQAVDDEGSFDFVDVTIAEVMDGRYNDGTWELRSDLHEDDWHESDSEKMEAFLNALHELGATGGLMAYQYVNAVPPEISLWKVGAVRAELSLEDLDPKVRDLLAADELFEALTQM